jgi:hypothetical protein
MTCLAKWSQPATYRIPRKYKSDRLYRTMLHEYQKNLAIVEIARKYDFVKSIVDFFSIELTFHGNKKDDVHRDAGEFPDMYF